MLSKLFVFLLLLLPLMTLKRLQWSQISLSVCVSVCQPVVSHISETSEAIAIKFDKVTASVMTMHCVSVFSSRHLDLWLHEHLWLYQHVLQYTGQCMLSERAFGVEKCVSLYDVRIQKMTSNLTICSHCTDSTADKWCRGDWFSFNQGHFGIVLSVQIYNNLYQIYTTE